MVWKCNGRCNKTQEQHTIRKPVWNAGYLCLSVEVNPSYYLFLFGNPQGLWQGPNSATIARSSKSLENVSLFGDFSVLLYFPLMFAHVGKISSSYLSLWPSFVSLQLHVCTHAFLYIYMHQQMFRPYLQMWDYLC